MPTVSVTLGDVTFLNDSTSGWGVEQLQGWWDLPDAKSEIVQRPAADGVFGSTDVTRDALRPSLRLKWKGASIEDAARELGALRRLSRPATVPLTVDDGTGPLTRHVQVRAVQVSTRFEWWNLPVFVDMLARDPLAYGTEVCQSTGLPVAGSGLQFPLGPDGSGTAGGFADWGTTGTTGQVLVENPGSAVAYPTFTVTGRLDAGFEVVEVESGARVRFERVVDDGSTVSFDARSGRAQVDGQSDVTGSLTVAEVFMVPSYGSRTYQFLALGGASGAPQLRVCVAPAYL